MSLEKCLFKFFFIFSVYLLRVWGVCTCVVWEQFSEAASPPPTGSGDHFLQARVATTSFLTVPIQILYSLRSLECFWLFDLDFVRQSLSAFLCILRFVCCCWSGNIFLHCCIAAAALLLLLLLLFAVLQSARPLRGAPPYYLHPNGFLVWLFAFLLRQSLAV